MSKRRPSSIPRVEWKVSLSAQVAAEVDLLTLDPITRKPRYGERGRLIEGLLAGWVADQKKAPSNAPN